MHAMNIIVMRHSKFLLINLKDIHGMLALVQAPHRTRGMSHSQVPLASLTARSLPFIAKFVFLFLENAHFKGIT